MSLANIFVEGAVGIVLGASAGFLLHRWQSQQRASARELEIKSREEASRREAESILREARLTANEESVRLREQSESAFQTRRREIGGLEDRLRERETLISRQLEGLLQQEKGLQTQLAALQKREEQLEENLRKCEELAAQRRKQLEEIGHLSETEARALFLREIEQQSLRDANSLSRHILEDAKAKSEQEARRIIAMAIQRYAGQHTFETTTATIALPGDEIKGRIIGREGRNIRSFEAATGVTVLIDDTPNAVVLSGFDPVRREIAREAMQRLILDGRIHPTRIEEIVAKVTEEMDEAILKHGEEAVFRVGLPPMHNEIVKVLGRLRFRQSFSQNILDHSVEVAHLVGIMAAELGLEVSAGKRAGLLHDIGKAMNHEVEGSHAIIGAELVKRYGESPEVVNGVASHHDEVPHVGPWGILVSAADAISASRPGARSETMTTYIKRLEDLEKIGKSFPGVEKCFAVQAGRELRVMVRPEDINDEQAYQLARSVTRKIEEELQYPGQIRVTVIRETRAIEFAK